MNIKGKAERTKQFIIEQSAPIFNSKGIAGTTIDDILAAKAYSVMSKKNSS